MFRELNVIRHRVMHNVNTRHKDLVHHCFRGYKILNVPFPPTIWNSLPLNLRSIDPLHRFKKELQKYFINKNV